MSFYHVLNGDGGKMQRAVGGLGSTEAHSSCACLLSDVLSDQFGFPKHFNPCKIK